MSRSYKRLYQELLKRLYETDKEGYPLSGHTRIAKMQIFAEDYTPELVQEVTEVKEVV